MTNKECLWKQAEESTRIIPRLSRNEQRTVVFKLFKIIIRALQAECPCKYCHGEVATCKPMRSEGVRHGKNTQH